MFSVLNSLHIFPHNNWFCIKILRENWTGTHPAPHLFRQQAHGADTPPAALLIEKSNCLGDGPPEATLLTVDCVIGKTKEEEVLDR